MNRNRLQTLIALSALAWLAAGSAALAAPNAPATPPPAAPAAASSPAAPSIPAMPSQADIDRQLKAAQQQLEHAADEVARLSTQFSGAMLSELVPLIEPQLLIGVQLEKTADRSGARVREVSPGGAAAEAGVRVDDIIKEVNGHDLRGDDPARQVGDILRGVKPETHVTLQVLRQGRPLEITVTPRSGPGLFAGSPGADFSLRMPELAEAFVHRPLRDMELATLTARLGSYFGTDRGVLVVRAPGDGALRLEDGDVILAIDGREPQSGAHATRILGSYQAGEKVTLRIIREHRPMELVVTLPERAGHREERHSSAQARARAERHLASAQTGTRTRVPCARAPSGLLL